MKKETYTCYKCKYFDTCGDPKRTEPCEGKSIGLTEGQAKEFYRDLCGTVYGDSNKNCGGIMSVEKIAEVMKMEIAKAIEFCDAMLEYDITECSCGMIIV